jgi:hypothetical protein
MNSLKHGRTCFLVCALSFLSLSLSGSAQLNANAAKTGTQPAVTERDGQHDFDFWFGNWKVQGRRLRHPLAGSNEWVEFDGTAVSRPVWGGRANADEFEFDSPFGHIEGMTVRTYNPKSHQWSIYWAAATKGVFEKQMIGQFKDGRGEFFDQEDFSGKAIFVRYVWSDIAPNSCRWEQAFSSDGGKTWEANWVMTMRREKQ